MRNSLLCFSTRVMAWLFVTISTAFVLAMLMGYVGHRSYKANAQTVDALANQIKITAELDISNTDTNGRIALLTVEKVQDLPDVALYRVLARRHSDNVLFSAISAKQLNVGDKVTLFYVRNQPHATSSQNQWIFVSVKAEAEK